jgi:hypothetical protein
MLAASVVSNPVRPGNWSVRGWRRRRRRVVAAGAVHDDDHGHDYGRDDHDEQDQVGQDDGVDAAIVRSDHAARGGVSSGPAGGDTNCRARHVPLGLAQVPATVGPVTLPSVVEVDVVTVELAPKSPAAQTPHPFGAAVVALAGCIYALAALPSSTEELRQRADHRQRPPWFRQQPAA